MSIRGSRLPTRKLLWLFAVALALRVAIAAWAAPRFAPAADGTYYDLLAQRIAGGFGYTWLWPDGAVTYAAHYPVGYPAFLAAIYTLLGRSPLSVMLVQACIAAAAAPSTAILASSGGARARPLLAGWLMALHPALLAYVPAYMTEGVTAALLASAFACATLARRKPRPWIWVLAACVLLAACVYMRPQLVLLAPVLGWIARFPRSALASHRSYLVRRIVPALAVSGMVLACVLPWTARNCVRMHSCALVSVNGGWNLLIGAQTQSGGWEPVAVPKACAHVFDEAGKDLCFGREGANIVRAQPGTWLRRIRAKWTMTFEYFGAAPYYLHASNPSAFTLRHKQLLGSVETLWSRAMLALAVGAAFARRAPHRLGVAALLLGALSLLPFAAAAAYLGLAFALLRTHTSAALASCAVIVSTAILHAIFFGAGRYGLVVTPFVAIAAASVPWRGRRGAGRA